MGDAMRRAAIGLKARTARAIAVVVAGDAAAPEALRRLEIVLSTSDDPATFQPYHAVMDMPWEAADAAARATEASIAALAAASIGRLLRELGRDGMHVTAAGVVGAPERRLSSIGNPHIRAHAAEGVLFRRVLQTAAAANGIEARAFAQRELEATAAEELGRSPAALRSVLTDLGRPVGRPWRADEKEATLAAWLVLAGRR